MIVTGIELTLVVADVALDKATVGAVESKVRVSVADAAQVEWRDAYFPYWRAWVNGAEVSVERTAQGMKAIRVPAGRSDVVVRFMPAALRATMAIGYVVLLAAAAACLVRTRGRADRMSAPR